MKSWSADGFDLHPTIEFAIRRGSGPSGRSEVRLQLLRDVQPFFQVDLFHLVPWMSRPRTSLATARASSIVSAAGCRRFAPTSHENWP